MDDNNDLPGLFEPEPIRDDEDPIVDRQGHLHDDLPIPDPDEAYPRTEKTGESYPEYSDSEIDRQEHSEDAKLLGDLPDMKAEYEDLEPWQNIDPGKDDIVPDHRGHLFHDQPARDADLEYDRQAHVHSDPPPEYRDDILGPKIEPIGADVLKDGTEPPRAAYSSDTLPDTRKPTRSKLDVAFQAAPPCDGQVAPHKRHDQHIYEENVLEPETDFYKPSIDEPITPLDEEQVYRPVSEYQSARIPTAVFTPVSQTPYGVDVPPKKEMVYDRIPLNTRERTACEEPIQRNVFALAGMILVVLGGLAGLAFGFPWNAIALVGLVLSIIGLVKANTGEYANRDLAIIGVVLGIAAAVWILLDLLGVTVFSGLIR